MPTKSDARFLPSNVPKCTPCSTKKPVKITNPPAYRNTTDLFTIGTVPHPYTLQSLNSQRAYLNLTWVRQESQRDLWLETVSNDLFKAKVSSSARLLKFKEAVAAEQTRYSSIWLTVERETPRDLAWWFGFELHHENNATPEVPDPKTAEKPKSQKRADADQLPTSEPQEEIMTDDERELQLLMKARAMRKTKDKNEIRIRDAIEAWNLADTEAWKFTKAFMARFRVERLKWEEEPVQHKSLIPTSQMADIPPGNVENGEKLFKARCAQCHTANKGGPNKQGPNLYGIFGRKTGQVPGYAYSPANKDANIVWGDRTLFDYLENPKKYIPKTKMAFPGFKAESDRSDVVAYLKEVTA